MKQQMKERLQQMRAMHEKHKEAMKAKRAANAQKASKSAKVASVRKSLPLGVPHTNVTVNSTDDADAYDATSSPATTETGSTITLRSAIDYADTTGSVDTVFVPADTYTLSFGELDIKQPVVIQGGGAGSTVVNGGGASRVFQIDNGPVTIVDLTVTQGYDLDGYGGGILVSGDSTVDLDSVNVTNSRADYGGGGLAIVGSATVTAKNCTFTYDSTTVGGGGTVVVVQSVTTTAISPLITAYSHIIMATGKAELLTLTLKVEQTRYRTASSTVTIRLIMLVESAAGQLLL